MKIKRLEFGIATICGKPAWKDLTFEAHKGMCGCYLIDIWMFYITWMGDECYFPCKNPECDCHK